MEPVLRCSFCSIPTLCRTIVLYQLRRARMNSEVKQLHSRARFLAAKFKRGEDTSCIDEAIDLDREALELCPPDHPERSSALTWLSNHLSNRYDRIGALRDLEEAIVLTREAFHLFPKGHADRPGSLNKLAARLSARYKYLGVMEDLEESIVLGREALDIRPKGHPGRSSSLNTLALRLSTRYDNLGSTEDLESAIVLGREALELRPKGHPNQSSSLNNLAVDLFTRYKHLGAMEDLGEAIVLGREALDLRPVGHANRSKSLDNLAVHLSARYNQLGVLGDLDEAILLGREALDLRPKGHSARLSSLHNLALCLSTRNKRLGVTGDLEEAIVLDREALVLCPKGHPDWPSSLSNLAVDLSTRYNQLGVDGDLDEAIVLGREALHLRPKGHPDRSMLLNNLAARLSTRYNQLRVMEDLDEAIVLGRETLDLRPKGHPGRSLSLNNLAVYLSTRYNQLGVLENLDEAIVLNREALDLRPKGHPDRSTSLNSLANHLSTRYKQLEVTEDLNEAIVLDREALDLRPKGHPDRSSSLNNLAFDLFTRYKHLGATEDLEVAIALHRETLGFRRKGHPDRPMPLNNLALCLSARYKQFKVMEDLDAAITLSQEALDLCPKGHPDRTMSLNNLALCLSTRYDHLKIVEDIEAAIDLGREALGLCQIGHPDRPRVLNNLALYLRSWFARSKQLQDAEDLLGLYAQLVHVTHIVSSSDLSAAREWIRVAEVFQHPTMVLAYETSLRLLVQHIASLPSLPQHLDILKRLTSSLAVDAFSACLRSHSPAKAVGLLEQARAVFWSQLNRLHSPLDDVVASGMEGKKLADEFTHLSSRVRNVLDSPGGDQHERLCHLSIEMQKVVTNIRKLPALSCFLLPPLFSDLQRAASGGPVIIVNASKYSCDALVVLLDRDPVHIPLQITQESVRDLSVELSTLTVRATRDDVTRELAAFLRKLWDEIVSPIVDSLRTTHPLQSRIWWCPTAEFSVLPLHAAGPFRKGQQNLPNLYISSYTPTLTALIRARRLDPSNFATQRRSFVTIGQAKAVGESELFSVGAELDNIRQLVSDVATFTHIEGKESCVSRVVEELGKNEWVHLACHGLPNRAQPFESAFALHDSHFTIQQIIKCNLKNPEFAYLSACHTTVGDEEGLDEVIHLASAMQFIGFRSVIGTMWAVDDGATTKISSTFYRHMVDESGRLDYTRAALALNKTMKSVNIPFDQRILYIHLGA
ncbi:TPR-like protein [Boletus edulis]|nr:TPR-like protein [Boletus edulis]